MQLHAVTEELTTVREKKTGKRKPEGKKKGLSGCRKGKYSHKVRWREKLLNSK